MIRIPLIRFLDNEQGASMLEYALLLALLAVVSIVGVTMVGKESGETFYVVGKEIADAMGEQPHGHVCNPGDPPPC